MSVRPDDDWDQKPEEEKDDALDAQLAYTAGILSCLRGYQALMTDRFATFNARSKDGSLPYEDVCAASGAKDVLHELLDYTQKAIDAVQAMPLRTEEEIS